MKFKTFLAVAVGVGTFVNCLLSFALGLQAGEHYGRAGAHLWPHAAQVRLALIGSGAGIVLAVAAGLLSARAVYMMVTDVEGS